MQINNEKLYPCSICKKKFILSILNIHTISCNIKANAIQRSSNHKVIHYQDENNLNSDSSLFKEALKNILPKPKSIPHYKCHSPDKVKASHKEIDYINDLNISNQQKYRSNAKAQKPLNNPKRYFMDKLQLELTKDEINYKNSKENMQCFLCNKQYPCLQMRYHNKNCEYNWKMNNANLDLNILKPELFKSIIDKIENKLEVKREDLDEYHQQIETLKKNAIVTFCSICAKSILSSELNNHIKLCQPKQVKNKVKEPLIDSKMIFQELLEKELKDNKYANVNSKNSNSKNKAKDKNQYKQKVKYDVEPIIKEEEKKQFPKQYEPCPNCQRKFLPERLRVHLRGCK